MRQTTGPWMGHPLLLQEGLRADLQEEGAAMTHQTVRALMDHLQVYLLLSLLHQDHLQVQGPWEVTSHSIPSSMCTMWPRQLSLQ